MMVSSWVVKLVALVAVGLAPEVHAGGCEEVTTAAMEEIDVKGVHLGNGGDVLVHRRPDGAILSAILLDFYESETQRGIIRDIGASDLSVEKKIEKVLNRIERLDQGRAHRYFGWYRTFLQESCFLSGVNLVDIPDSQHVQLPAGSGWAIEQIAVQREPRFPEDRRYIINKDLWDVLDNDSRAGLLLHEFIYRDAVTSGAQDSVGVRYLLSASTATKIDEWDFKTYVDRLLAAGFGDVSYSGIWLDIKAESILFEQSKPAVAFVKRGTVFKSRWGDIPLDCRVQFHSDGEISAFSILPASSGAFMQVGNYRLELSSGSYQTPDCNAGKNARWDVFLSNPSHPEKGLTHVTTFNLIPVSGPSFNAVVTQGMWFEDGELLGGRNRPFIDNRTYAVIGGQDCALDHGPINFAGGTLETATLTRCAIPIWRSTAYAVGEIQLVTEDEHLQPLQMTLEADQRLNVGFGDYDAVFKGGTRLTLTRPDGKIKVGTLASDAVLCGPQGQMQLYFAGMQLEFDSIGCVVF